MPFAPAREQTPRPSRLMRASAAWSKAPRFVRNAAISLPTFLLDLGALFLLVHRAHVGYLPATVLAFLLANGVGYFLSRWWVFTGTSRGLRAGLVYFFAIAAISALTLTPLMWLLVGVFHLGVILSRIVAASMVGVGGYLVNLIFNFRVAGD
jgi:putative flippase GtrA